MKKKRRKEKDCEAPHGHQTLLMSISIFQLKETHVIISHFQDKVYKKITCVTVNLITCIVFCVIYLLLTNSKNLQSLPSGIDGNGYALSHIFACLAQSRSKPYNGEHDKTFKKYKTLFMIMLLTWLPGMLFSDTQISHSPQLSKPLEKL